MRDATEAAASIGREQTFRLSGTPMCVADAAGDVLCANRAFEGLFGTDRALPSLFVRGEERRQAALVLRQAAELESDVTLEGCCATPSGAEVTVSWSLRSADRVVLAEARDVTAAAPTLREGKEPLRAAQKMEIVGRLAGGVAHEFNNQLTVILGRLQMLQRSLGLGDDERAHVYEAAEAAMRAATLTRRLLALSRRQVLAPTALDLNEVATETHAMFGRVLGDHADLDD